MKLAINFLIFLLLLQGPILKAQQGTLFECGTEEDLSSNQVSAPNTVCNYTYNALADFRNLHTDDIVPQGINETLKLRANVVFVQDENGNGSFSVSNPDHIEFFNNVFQDMNNRLSHLTTNTCTGLPCSGAPLDYSDIHIEYVPYFYEVQHKDLWNHRNDPNKTTLNSANKKYLLDIYDLVKIEPGFEPGLTVIITNDGDWWDKYLNHNPNNVDIWTLGYNYQTNVYGPNWYSMQRKINPLSAPAMWHCPDLYLSYQNGLEHYGGQWWIDNSLEPTTAGMFLHEFGHMFWPDVWHAPTNCYHNIMNPMGAHSTYFHDSYAGCQSREAFLSLMTGNIRNSVICEDKLDYDIIVDSDENWNLNIRIYGGIRVKSGSTLTISCEVHMSPGAQIIVERGGRLIVDGGIITGDCTDKWQGIIVEGDVTEHQINSGKVVLQNSAIIENAFTGVSMYPSHLPWNNGDQENYYGGLIEASFATIQHCDKAVEFMKYGRSGVKDQSFFHDVTFDNLQSGVFVWADDGVTFQHCNFSNIAEFGIHSVDCEVIANSANTFSESVATGISLISTSSTIFSSKIGDLNLGGNNFNSTIGVDIQSTGNVEPLEIINNYFDGNTRGIKQNGIGLLNIQKNSFSDTHKAIEIFEAGDKFNLIKQNDLSDSYIGSHSIKNNLGLRYFNNCFTSSYLMDIAVTVGGIFPYQGNQSVAAGNCFTKNHVTEIYNSSSSPIYYFVKSGTPTSSCKYPQYLFNVTLNANSQDEPTGACGPGPGPIPITRTSDLCNINTSQSISQLQSERNSLIQAMHNVTGGPNSYDAKNYAQCIEVIESVIGKKMLTPGSGDPDAGKENAITFYTSSNMTFEDSIIAYGIMVEFGELTRARSFLNVLHPHNQEQTNFVTVQNINLDYLAHPQAYSASQSTKNQLYSIGTSDGPYNGYARSLYEVLTGERIEVDIPIEWRSITSNINEAEQPSLKLFPNPSSDDYFTVYLNGLAEGNYHIRLITPMGGVISEQLIRGNGEYIVGFSDITAGLYFVTLNDDIGTTILHSKILLFK